MKSLKVVYAKPNPAGMDRSRLYVDPAQLAAEWVDFRNDGTESFDLTPVTVQHLSYGSGCGNGEWKRVMSFSGSLSPGSVVRVHSGGEIPLSQMHPEDARGADFHLFTGVNYIWNNDCGDTVGLWNGSSWIDKASYQPNPPERVLRRVGNQLV